MTGTRPYSSARSIASPASSGPASTSTICRYAGARGGLAGFRGRRFRGGRGFLGHVTVLLSGRGAMAAVAAVVETVGGRGADIAGAAAGR